MIDEKIVKQILEEVFCSVEDVEAQSAAILQFLKEKGMANDKELAPYLEQAKTSSGVRWVAIRARVDYLLSSIINNEEKEAAAKTPNAASSKSAAAEGAQETSSPEEDGGKTEVHTKQGDAQKTDAQQTDAQNKDLAVDRGPAPPARDTAA